MTCFQLLQNRLSRAERLVRPSRIHGLTEHAQDVVRILWPLEYRFALKYKPARLIDFELGAFNEVAEVGLKEREVHSAVLASDDIGNLLQWRGTQNGCDLLEKCETGGIPGYGGGQALTRCGLHRRFAGSENGPDEVIQNGERFHQAERRRQFPR